MPDFEPFRLGDAINAGQGVALNQLRLTSGINEAQAQQGLQQATQAGTPEAMDSYRKSFPVQAQAFDAKNMEFKKHKIEYHMAELETMGRLASGVTDQPSYERALSEAKQLGIDTSNAPPQFDPNWAKQTQEQAYSAKDRLAAAHQQIELLLKTKTHAETERHNRESERLHQEDINIKKGGGLSDDAKQLAVDRLLAGEKPSSVLANLGRGAQGANDLRGIQNLLATTAKNRGVSGPQLVKIMQSTSADGRAITELGAREGKIAARVQEAQNFAQVAKDASAQVDRGSFVPWNKLSQMGDTQMSNPKLAKLKAATVSLINAYAAAIGGGTPTVHDKEAAEHMLSTAQSSEAYNAVVDQMILETQQALAAPGQVRERMTGIKPQDAKGSVDTPQQTNVGGVKFLGFEDASR
jgi:hypothetical protein